jgi:hypothetical protein
MLFQTFKFAHPAAEKLTEKALVDDLRVYPEEVGVVGLESVRIAVHMQAHALPHMRGREMPNTKER